MEKKLLDLIEAAAKNKLPSLNLEGFSLEVSSPVAFVRFPFFYNLNLENAKGIDGVGGSGAAQPQVEQAAR